LSSDFIPIIGYGTFITHDFWKDKKNVEVCIVKNYIRIFIPKRNWFPYALPLKNSFFKALKFEPVKIIPEGKRTFILYKKRQGRLLWKNKSYEKK